MPRGSKGDSFGVGRMEGRDTKGAPGIKKVPKRQMPKSSAKGSITAGYAAGPKKGRARGGQYKYQVARPNKAPHSNTMGSPKARGGGGQYRKVSYKKGK